MVAVNVENETLLTDNLDSCILESSFYCHNAKPVKISIDVYLLLLYKSNEIFLNGVARMVVRQRPLKHTNVKNCQLIVVTMSKFLNEFSVKNEKNICAALTQSIFWETC